ncbi:MAG: pilus assembly protein TadG-related protein [Acidimicrobiia bacterium]
MKNFYRKLRGKGRDRGSALVFIAGSMVLLMGMAAFGVDLAWFYLNSSRVQRAADAASLGGVIHLPTDEPSAISNARLVATQNGFDDSAADTTVTPVRIASNQLQVTVTREVPTFFLKVFGFQSQTITETAVAEYIPPLKLGSPANKFGNDPSCYSTNSNCAGNFWANIHGTKTDTQMGDAFSSYCAVGGGSSTGCSQNSQYRDTGYLYGVIPNGNSVSIQTLDLNFRNENGGVANDDPWRTGDHNNFCGNGVPSCVGPSVRVNVYRPDPTPLDISDSILHCTEVYAPLPQIGPDDDPPFDPAQWNYWDSVCASSIDTSLSPNGIWVVQIVANDANGDGHTDAGSSIEQAGLNRYSIRTNTGNIFALSDFSIYNNASGTATQFYLAEVPDYYAGKTFVVEMYDTGESAATGTLQPIDPSTGNIFSSGECRIYSRTIAQTNWGPPDTVIPAGSNCQESVNPGEYNGLWLKFEIDIPLSYTCTNCWWRMNYNYPTAVNDTTTWRAYMIGNPIHLIP